MLIAQAFRGVSVALVVGTTLIAAHAQENSLAPPPQEQPPTIFGPVRRTPPPAPADFLRLSPLPETPLPKVPSQGPVLYSSLPQVTADGPVCLRTVLVDPKIDPRFVRPVPEVGATIQRVVPPPCVPTAPPIVRP